MPGPGESGEYNIGRLAGKVESMEGSIENIREDTQRLFEGQEEIKVNVQRVADATETQAAQTEVFIKQCAACREDQSKLTTRVTTIEKEIGTAAIRRKVNGTPSSQSSVARDKEIERLREELEKAQANSAVSWVQTAFKNSMIKLFEAAIWVFLIGGILWIAGAFDA